MYNNHQGSAKASLRWSLFHRKRGVSNIVLMLGVALCMVVLLVGGFLLVTKFIDAQAKASPEYVATELVTLINTVQTAPETITFNYYPDTDVNGFPIIGSLEIDDSSNNLCVHPKTEGEIYNSIMDQAAIAAGFGGIGYASNSIRSATAKKATIRSGTDTALFGSTTSKLTTNNLKILSQDTEGAAGLRKAIASGDEYAIDKALMHPDLEGKLTQADVTNLITNKDEPLLKYYMKATEKPDGIVATIKSKLPWTDAYKQSQIGQRVMTNMEQDVAKEEPTMFQRVLGGVTKVKAVGKPMAMFAAIFAASYILSGGDWVTSTLVSTQIVVMAYMPKLIGILVKKLAPNFAKRLAGALPTATVTAYAYKTFGTAAMKDPEPISKAAMLGVAAVAKATEIIINVAFSVYNTINLDMTLLAVYTASNHQMNKEKNAMSCKTFITDKPALLTPPNCQPDVQYGTTFNDWHLVLATELYTSATIMAGASGWAIATGLDPDVVSFSLTVPGYIAAAAAIGIPIGSLVATVGLHPLDLLPNTKNCKPNPDMSTNTCDTTYLRQDCPNWFISDYGEWNGLAGGSFVGILQGGPACAAVGVFGSMASFFCDASRVMYAIAIFVTDPKQVYGFFLQTSSVGFNKKVGAKTSSDFPELGTIFSNNEKFWYAELPYVIEITKVYTNSTQNPPIIIRKM